METSRSCDKQVNQWLLHVSLEFIKVFSPWEQCTVRKHAVHIALSLAFITYWPIWLLINIHHYITQLKVHINRCNGTEKMKRTRKYRIFTSKISPFIWLELMNMITRENLKPLTNFIRSFSFLKSYNWIMSFAFSAAFGRPLVESTCYFAVWLEPSVRVSDGGHVWEQSLFLLSKGKGKPGQRQ